VATVFERGGASPESRSGATRSFWKRTSERRRKHEQFLTFLGQFLAERAKQELTAYLSHQLKAACKEDVEGLAPAAKVSGFVPSLCRLFDTDSDAGIALFALGRMLRAAAKADLERLPDYVLWRVQAGDGDAAGAALAARVMLQMALELHRGAEPLRLVASLELMQMPSHCGSHCTPMVLALQGIGKSTAIAEPVIRLAADGRAASPYAFAAVALSIDEAPLPSDVSELPQKLAELTEKVGKLVRLGGEIVLLHQALADAKTSDDKAAIIKALLARSLEVVRLDVDGAVPEPRRPAVLAAVRLAELAVEGDLAGVTTQLNVVVSQLGRERVSAGARRILGLAGELAGAQSSEEVAKIIEAAAAPPGGYRIKYAKPTFAVTGLLGAAYYFDKSLVDSGALPSTAGTDRTLYLAGMVGLHGTMPTSVLHLGLFLSVIDLGTFVRASLSDDTGSPEFGDPIELDLGGLGIRSLSWWRQSYLIAAGPTDEVGPSRLYRWTGPGALPRLAAEAAFGDAKPEAFFSAEGNDEILILSDDGSRKVHGKACKKLKSFRGLWLKLPDGKS
jgi:hypothetical protein